MTGGLLVRPDVANRLAGWSDVRHGSLAEYLVGYLRAMAGEDQLRGVAPGTFTFPLTETLGGGAYRIERLLQGQGAQKLLLGRDLATGDALLIALDTMSRVDLRAFQRSIAYESPGVLQLDHVGMLDLTARGDISSQVAAWGLVERAPRGSWLPSLLGTFDPEVVFEPESRQLPSHDPRTALVDALSLGRGAGKILARAAEKGILLTRVRPEYMWAQRVNGVLEITGLSARGDAFFETSRTDAVSWPVFDRYYYAPEEHTEERDDRALVFSLSIMIAEWATGRFPYQRKYHDVGPLTGEHLPLALPTPLARLLSRGMRLDRDDRPGLAEFLGLLSG